MTRYYVDNANLTVIRIGRNGERHDLNNGGYPCDSSEDLADFIAELHDQGAYSIRVRDALLANVA